MKNVRDAGFSRKRGGNAGSGPPLPDPRLSEARFLLDKQHDFEAFVYPLFSRRSLLTPELCNVRSLCKILRQLLC